MGSIPEFSGSPFLNNEAKVIIMWKISFFFKNLQEIDYGKIRDRIGALLLLIFLR